MRKTNEQHQFDLIYNLHNVIEGSTYKSKLTGVDIESRHKVSRAFRTKKTCKVALVLEAIQKRVMRLNTQEYFKVIMGMSLKVMWLLKHSVNIGSKTTKYRHTHTGFVQTLNNMLTKFLKNFKIASAHGYSRASRT